MSSNIFLEKNMKIFFSYIFLRYSLIIFLQKYCFKLLSVGPCAFIIESSY